MDNTFSKRLKGLRTSLSLTQSDFAKEIGTTQATLSSYENSSKLPSIDLLISIAKKYNVSIDWLCGLQNGPTTAQTISTYSDIISVLSNIGVLDNLKTSISIINKSNPDLEEHAEAEITIDDGVIVRFFEEWIDVLALCKKSPSGKKLYDIWLKDILERYDLPIKINPTKRHCDLPFN
ncbi:XRE family transcriptional regulator [Clostridiaceae bacterium]|nr:XRE family transcriptional regulator [Clostridiaceae bacterium]